MKLLLIGDLHFHRSGPMREGYRYPEGLEIPLRTVEWAAQMVAKHSPDIVIQLGDVNHSVGATDIQVVSAVSRAFYTLAAACDTDDVQAEVYVVGGNHDQHAEDGSVSFVEMFQGWGHGPGAVIPVVDSLAVWGSREEDEPSVAMIPYCRDLARFYSMAEEAQEEDGARILCCHQELRGGVYPTGKEITRGVDLSRLKFARKVYAGDVHHPQEVGKGRGVHVGAALHHSHADRRVRGCPRGAMLVTVEGEEIVEERLANPHTFQYVTVKLEGEADRGRLEKLAERSDAARLKIRVLTAPDSVSWLGEFKESFGALSVLPHRVEAEAARDVEAGLDLDPLALVRETVAEADLEAEGLDADRLLEIGEAAVS